MDCKILIFNASGSNTGEEKVEEISEKRRVVVSKVIFDGSSNIILIQESHIALTKICTEEFGDRNYKAIGPKRNGIIYDMDTIMYVEDPTTRLRQIYESKSKSIIRNESAEIFARMCARVLKGTGVNAQPTLFVSWHGPHKKTMDYKRKLYHDLCLVFSHYAFETNIPVIIGGDFNLDLINAKNLEVCPPTNLVCLNTLEVNDYSKLERRPNKIDFILTSPKITVEDCKPINVFNIIEKLFPEFMGFKTELFVKAILDHDPLIANVIIPNQEVAFTSLLELNPNKSYQKGIEDLNQFSETQTRANHEDSENHDPLVANVIIPNQEEAFTSLSELNPNKSYQKGIEDLHQFSETQTRACHEDSEHLDYFSETETRANPKVFADLDQLLMTKPVQDFDHRYHLPYPRFPPNFYNNNFPLPVPMTPCKQYYYPPYPWSMPPQKTLFSLLSPYPLSMTLPNQYLDYYHPYQ